MILHGIRLARPADDIDLSDLTASTRTGPAYWEEGDVLVMPLDPEPTPEEAAKIRRRLVTADAADEQRLYDLLAARASAGSPFERLWLDSELARYGEQP